MNRKNRFLFIIILFLATSILGCKRESSTPKPRGYFRIDLPKKEYKKYKSNYPYTFEYPTCANISSDTRHPKKRYWININYPDINGKIHISYKNVNNNLQEMLEDSRELAYKHTIKAESINEKIFLKPGRNVYGMLYEIEGNTASSVQFYLTDSTKHFLRGALYFNIQPNKDSLAPVINFVKEDIKILMETFKWK
ncbi:MAG: gliding motility lipoprotein GldD [Bacteroidales bacterium]|jgi:gliding motility-associated lipoprotein GldD|nr:gliding motility lipoprotein GldD [Bacteroidales bacterium]